MEAVLYSLDAIGYSVAWRVLDAQFFGVPQRRNRVFLVGYRGGWAGAAAVLFEPEGEDRSGIMASTAVSTTLTKSIACGHCTGVMWLESTPPDPNGVREASGLSGRLDRPHTPDSPRYRQLGNAVAVPVVYWIARRMMLAHRLLTPPEPAEDGSEAGRGAEVREQGIAGQGGRVASARDSEGRM